MNMSHAPSINNFVRQSAQLVLVGSEKKQYVSRIKEFLHVILKSALDGSSQSDDGELEMLLVEVVKTLTLSVDLTCFIEVSKDDLLKTPTGVS